MKNNQALFIAGVLIGGVIMACVLMFQIVRGSASASPTSAPAPPVGPRLIALETNLPARPTAASLSPTFTITPGIIPTPTNLRTTATPLMLVREQQPETIGFSTEGRPMHMYTFGDGERERMIVADIHGGDEWNTLTLANQLIQHLNQNPQVIPEDVTLYILPSLNPDGEARSHDKYGRLNANGVDLNRNFPVNWLTDWERAGCWNYLPTSGGTGPGSEAETQALMDFITSHEIEVLISYHSAALGVFPGGDPWDEESIRLAESIAEVSTYRYPPLDTGCTYSGTLPDFAVSQGAASVDIELTNHIETDLDQNLNILEVLLNWQAP